MTTTGYRITYLLLAVALVAIIGGAILFIPSGDPLDLPDAVESYVPANGDLVTQPIRIVIDLLPNYDVTFVIDGTPIPSDQVDSILATGRHQFEAGEGKAIERWAGGGPHRGCHLHRRTERDRCRHGRVDVPHPMTPPASTRRTA